MHYEDFYESFLLFLVDHYSTRLSEELKKDNTPAVAFLRETLFNLKKKI